MLKKTITLKLENGQDLTIELTPIKFSQYSQFSSIEDELEMLLKIIYASTGKDEAWLETELDPSVNTAAFVALRDACIDVNGGFFALFVGAQKLRQTAR